MTLTELLTLTEILEGNPQQMRDRFDLVKRIQEGLEPVGFTAEHHPDGTIGISVNGEPRSVLSADLPGGKDFTKNYREMADREYQNSRRQLATV